jgi:hypothetical protein
MSLRLSSFSITSNGSRRTTDNMTRALAGFIALLCGAAFGQAPGPVQSAFRAGTNLVIVPFQVSRGSLSVSDLKSADVVLLEDGVPRAFTVFETPPANPVLELVVMFDVTDVKQGGFGDAMKCASTRCALVAPRCTKARRGTPQYNVRAVPRARAGYFS